MSCQQQWQPVTRNVFAERMQGRELTWVYWRLTRSVWCRYIRRQMTSNIFVVVQRGMGSCTFEDVGPEESWAHEVLQCGHNCVKPIGRGNLSTCALRSKQHGWVTPTELLSPLRLAGSSAGNWVRNNPASSEFGNGVSTASVLHPKTSAAQGWQITSTEILCSFGAFQFGHLLNLEETCYDKLQQKY